MKDMIEDREFGDKPDQISKLKAALRALNEAIDKHLFRSAKTGWQQLHEANEEAKKVLIK